MIDNESTTLSTYVGAASAILASILGSTVLILSLQISSTFLPKDVIRAHVSEGFENGALPLHEFPPDRFGLVRFFFVECEVLAMTFDARERLEQAVSPRIIREKNWKHSCALLERFSRGVEPEHHYYKHRYWFGVKPMLQLLLTLTDMETTQWLSLLVCVCCIATLPLAAWRNARHCLPQATTIGACALLLSGLATFSPLITHTAGFAFGFAASALLLTLRQFRRSGPRLVALAAAIGMLTWYVDVFLNAPMVMVLTFYVVYIADRDCAAAADRLRQAVICLVGFTTGFAASILLKNTLAWLAGFGGVWGAFVAHTLRRMDLADYPLPDVDPFLAVYANVRYIAFGSTTAGLFVTSFAALLFLVSLAWRICRSRGRPDREILVNLTMIAASMLLLISWFYVFRNTVIIHAPHFSRHLFLMIALLLVASIDLVATRPVRRDATRNNVRTSSG